MQPLIGLDDTPARHAAWLRRMVSFALRPPWYVRWGFALGVLALLLGYFDPLAVAESLGGVDWWIAAPAIAGLVLVHVIGAVTWRLLSRQLSGLEMDDRTAVRQYYVGQAFGTITPANVGADAYRAAAVHTPSAGWARAVTPIVVQRAGSSAALALLGLAATAAVPVAPVTRIALAFVLLLGLVFVLIISSRSIGVGHKAENVGTFRATANRRWRRGGITSLAGGLAFHLVALGFSAALVFSVHGDVDLPSVLAAMAVARVTMLLPLTPNGLGFQEAALVLLLPRVGVPAESAVAAAALARVAMLITMSLGFGLMLPVRLPPRSREPVAVIGTSAPGS